MVVTVTLNPCIDRTLFVQGLAAHSKNKVIRTEIDAGGKGINVSRVLAALGTKTVATGLLGGGSGAFVRHVLDQESVPHEFVQVMGETRTNLSIEDGSLNPPTTFNEAGIPATGIEIEKVLGILASTLQPGNWLVLAGSLPPGLSENIYATVTGAGRAMGANVVLDADGEALRLGLEAKPDFIKPNADEVSRLTGSRVGTLDEAAGAAERLLSSLSEGGRAVVSMGKLGAALAGPAGTFVAHAPVIEPKSTIGSGDSMVAGVLSAWMNGLDDADALGWGAAAGAATALSDGKDIGTKEDFDALLPKVRVTRV